MQKAWKLDLTPWFVGANKPGLYPVKESLTQLLLNPRRPVSAEAALLADEIRAAKGGSVLLSNSEQSELMAAVNAYQAWKPEDVMLIRRILGASEVPITEAPAAGAGPEPVVEPAPKEPAQGDER